MLTIPNASIIGDLPGLAELFIAPTSATSATSYGGAQKTDSVYWSFAAKTSFQAHWRAASANPSSNAMVGTLIGDLLCSGPASPPNRDLDSQRLQRKSEHLRGQTFTDWNQLTSWIIPPVLEPAYRGRFRAYTWAKWSTPTSSPDRPFQLSIDVVSGTAAARALVSAAPVASLPMGAPSTATTTGGNVGASPAYSLIDLGEVALPPLASIPFETQIRLWGFPGTSNLGFATTASAALDIGGLYLQPLDGAAGVLPRGLLQPTWPAAIFSGRFYISAVSGDVTIESVTSAVASRQPHLPVIAFHRGLIPRTGSSVLQLDINIAGKQTLNAAPTSHPPLRSEPHFAQVSVRYRPRFIWPGQIRARSLRVATALMLGGSSAQIRAKRLSA